MLANIKLVVLLALLSAATAAIGYNNKASGVVSTSDTEFHIHINPKTMAPIAVAGDNNVCVTWWTNKSGNFEVMFRASIAGGKEMQQVTNHYLE
jgi:hypothetical protein